MVGAASEMGVRRVWFRVIAFLFSGVCRLGCLLSDVFFGLIAFFFDDSEWCLIQDISNGGFNAAKVRWVGAFVNRTFESL